MEAKSVNSKFHNYVVNVDEDSDNIEVWAEYINENPHLQFIRDGRTVAEFKTWRYWRMVGEVVVGWSVNDNTTE